MTKPRPSSFLQLLLIVPLLAFIGCDSITGGDDDDITGTWTATYDGITEVLVITDTHVMVFSQEAGNDCFERFEFEIESSTGDTYTLAEVGVAFTMEIVIRRSGDDLEVSLEDGVDVVTYSSTNINVSGLTICAGGGDGDTSVACTALDQIGVGATITAELTTTDKQAPSGAYYDMYGLQLASQQEVQIDLSSDQIDTYLYLYDSDGTLLDSNDDFGDGLDSSLTMTLSAGCYRIEASSFNEAETGSYTLSVN